MSNALKMELCFKAAEIKKLLEENPDATTLVVTQEIKTVIDKKTKKCLSTYEVNAHVSGGSKPLKMLVSAARGKAPSGGKGGVGGCPNPPGCG